MKAQSPGPWPTHLDLVMAGNLHARIKADVPSAGVLARKHGLYEGVCGRGSRVQASHDTQLTELVGVEAALQAVATWWQCVCVCCVHLCADMP